MVNISATMNKFIICLLSASSLWASQTLTLDTAGAKVRDGNFYISPYTGTLTSSNGGGIIHVSYPRGHDSRGLQRGSHAIHA